MKSLNRLPKADKLKRLIPAQLNIYAPR